jgi:glyoxylase-like metal-dependent hydrolase (beta-lactamase superfamily II)
VLDEGLGNQSYVVELGDGRALVIDPKRNPRPYLDLAARRALRLSFAVETHLHADFISGGRELASQGTRFLAPRAAELQTTYQGLADGDEVDLGRLRLRALATPGHTPEHLAYLILDRSTPLALFSGGALIPGGAARTDLIDSDQTEPLARAVYRSVRQHLAGLPDDVVIYPTHAAGSFCSAGAGGQRTTTLGHERHMNPLLTARDEDAFVRTFLSGLGTYPSYFRRLRSVNQRGARLYGTILPVVRLLSVEDFRRQIAAGATLIDTRPFQEFAAGHISGAVSITLRPAFASWLGWLVPIDRPLILLMGPDQDRGDLVSQCLNIGYEDIAGELEGGMAGWRGKGLPEMAIAIRQANEDVGKAPLDVRQDNEWARGHLPGAQHLELGILEDSAHAIAPGPLTIYCGHGERAMTAASLLEAHGRKGLAVLDGGFQAWSDAGRPVTAG